MLPEIIKYVITGDLTKLKQQITELDIDVNTTNGFGENLLFIACDHNRPQIVEFLLENGADVNQLNRINWSPLFKACAVGNLESVKKLIQHGANAKHFVTKPSLRLHGSEECVTPLFLACEYQNLEVVEYLINNNLVDKDAFKRSYFHLGSPFSKNVKCDNSEQILSLLYSHDLINNAYLENPFPIFENLCSSTCLNGIPFMLQKFPSLQKNIPSPALGLIDSFVYDEDGNLENSVLNLFLEKKYLAFDDLNEEGQTLLHICASTEIDEYDNVEILRRLLELGFPIELKNSRRQTPLHVAIEAGLHEHAKFLINSGANKLALDNEGKSPLDYANNFCALALDAEDEYNIEFKNELLQALKIN